MLQKLMTLKVLEYSLHFCEYFVEVFSEDMLLTFAVAIICVKKLKMHVFCDGIVKHWQFINSFACHSDLMKRTSVETLGIIGQHRRHFSVFKLMCSLPKRPTSNFLIGR